MGKWLIGALLATVAWAPAQAQDGRDGWRSRRGGEQQQGQPRPEGQRGGWRNQAAQPQPQVAVEVQPQVQTQTQAQTGERRGGWNRDGRSQTQVRGDGNYQARRDWQRQQQEVPAAQVEPQQNWSNRDRNDDRRRESRDNGDRGLQSNGQTWRTDGREGNRRDDARGDGRYDNRRDNARNDGRSENRRDDNRGYDNRGWNNGQRYEHRGNWNRTWRQDNRYDWNAYRSGNRNAFRLPRYYAPHGWGYGYRRFSIGIALSSSLWGQNYWIDDPWSYRLPEAYGPYRWVRYYNDALLVDIRTGTVVDTVYDIFYY